MNGRTKNDLSFDEVKLDYKALITTAQVAIHGCIEEISRYERTIRDYGLYHNDNTKLHMDSKRLADEANLLAICADTLAALKEGEKREIVTIVNKDEVPEKE